MRNVLAALGILAFVGFMGLTAYFMFRRDQKQDEATWGVEWAPWTSTAGRYTISFPHRPRETSEGSTLRAHYALVHDDDYDEDYDVEVTQLTKKDAAAVAAVAAAAAAADVEKDLDAAIDEVVSSEHMTLVSRSKIALDGKHPGRAAMMKDPDKPVLTAKTRIYIVNDRRYMILAKGVRKDANVERFLNSFTLVK